MTSSKAKNTDSQSSNVEPINNLLDVLFDSASCQDSLSGEEDCSHSSPDNSDILDSDKSNEIDKFEKIAESKRLETPAELPDDSQSNNHKDELSEIEVEVKVESEKDITLEKAVQFKAFLRQTVDSELEQNSPQNQSDNNSIEKYEDALSIETESASTEELAAAVNSLIPLVVELLKYKIDDSQESILRGVTPILEKIIEQRTIEEPQKMAAAIAKILPFAIAENINISPEEIAKAIAPELALSIKEQIRLDENAISEALGSEMGKAIKTQIEVEKDAMVDALYPVIGDTISKYMVEVVKEINSKVENTLSPDGFKRKLQAKMRGVTEAELILQESVGCHVQAVFLIDKDSGLIIQQVQQSGEKALDSDMVGGMLTAIRSFANDCIVSGSELDSIDYGNWQIHLEAAGYCYLAVVLKGEPNRKFIRHIRDIFGDIILNYGKAIERFQGNIEEDVPPEIKTKLKTLIEPKIEFEKKASSPNILLWLVVFVLAIILIPFGLVGYRSRIAQNIEQITAIQLDAAPELSVYRLEPTVKKGKLIVQGRVPSEYLRNRAAVISQNIADKNNVEFNNQIATVDIPVNPNLLIGEITRLTKLFNQQSEVAIKTNYKPSNLSIEGFVINRNQEKSIIEAFLQIPGVKQTTINIANQLPKIEERIYFDSASNKVNVISNSNQINNAIAFLNQYPDLNLKLLAYSDGVGSKKTNQRLGSERCSSLKDALIAKGVDSSRLATDCNTYRISTRQPNQTVKLTRYVKFEPIIPTK